MMKKKTIKKKKTATKTRTRTTTMILILLSVHGATDVVTPLTMRSNQVLSQFIHNSPPVNVDEWRHVVLRGGGDVVDENELSGGITVPVPVDDTNNGIRNNHNNGNENDKIFDEQSRLNEVLTTERVANQSDLTFDENSKAMDAYIGELIASQLCDDDAKDDAVDNEQGTHVEASSKKEKVVKSSAEGEKKVEETGSSALQLPKLIKELICEKDGEELEEKTLVNSLNNNITETSDAIMSKLMSANRSSQEASMEGKSRVEQSLHSPKNPRPLTFPYNTKQSVHPLYRVLLRRRNWGGHYVLMGLVMMSEWIHVWLPGLAKMIDAFLTKLFRKKSRDENDRRFDSRLSSSSPSSSSASYSSVLQLKRALRISKKSDTSQRKQQLKLLQDASDRAAMRLISEWTNARSKTKYSRYQYTSLMFQQRHGLLKRPKFTKTEMNSDSLLSTSLSSGVSSRRSTTTESSAKNIWETTTAALRGLAVTSIPTDTTNEDSNEEGEEDVEWIMRALTASNHVSLKKERAQSSGVKVNPTVSLQVGPRGPDVSVGIDFSFGKQSDRSHSPLRRNIKKRRKFSSDPFSCKAITVSADDLRSVLRTRTSSTSRTASTRSKLHHENSKGSKYKSTSSFMTSDRDAGVLGRIRAATSENLSRSLLGAYPGNAPSLQDASSVDGVIDLATRYGYGDWSSDEDDVLEEKNDDALYATPRRNKKHRRKKSLSTHVTQNSTSSTGSSFGIDFESRSMRPRDPELDQRAMKRVEAVHKRSVSRGRGVPVGSALNRVNELNRRNRSSPDYEDR